MTPVEAVLTLASAILFSVPIVVQILLGLAETPEARARQRAVVAFVRASSSPENVPLLGHVTRTIRGTRIVLLFLVVCFYLSLRGATEGPVRPPLGRSRSRSSAPPSTPCTPRVASRPLMRERSPAPPWG